MFWNLESEQKACFNGVILCCIGIVIQASVCQVLEYLKFRVDVLEAWKGSMKVACIYGNMKPVVKFRSVTFEIQ